MSCTLPDTAAGHDILESSLTLLVLFTTLLVSLLLFGMLNMPEERSTRYQRSSCGG